jgi:hypothetical protein
MLPQPMTKPTGHPFEGSAHEAGKPSRAIKKRSDMTSQSELHSDTIVPSGGKF